MTNKLRNKSGVEVLEFTGDLSAEEMVRVKQCVARLLKKNRKKLLFDLSRARRVDLAGLGIFVDRLRTVRAQKGDIKLCNASPAVQQAFEITGLSGLIETFHSEEEAIRSFAA